MVQIAVQQQPPGISLPHSLAECLRFLHMPGELAVILPAAHITGNTADPIHIRRVLVRVRGFLVQTGKQSREDG
ncbi:hypothetical protein D3C75_1079910 [compost metagenome]